MDKNSTRAEESRQAQAVDERSWEEFELEKVESSGQLRSPLPSSINDCPHCVYADSLIDTGAKVAPAIS